MAFPIVSPVPQRRSKNDTTGAHAASTTGQGTCTRMAEKVPWSAVWTPVTSHSQHERRTDAHVRRRSTFQESGIGVRADPRLTSCLASPASSRCPTTRMLYTASSLNKVVYHTTLGEAYFAEHRMTSCYTVLPDTLGAIAVDCYPKSTILSCDTAYWSTVYLMHQ